jgi:ribosomal protein S18 acetylase RimI-like enzyme
VSRIYVSAEDKPPGLEKLLVEAASNEIVKGGAKKIQASVLATKEELMETLENLGFKEVLAMDAMVAEF